MCTGTGIFAITWLPRKPVDFWLTYVVSSVHQMTALHMAAEGARIKIMNELVGKGADVNIQNHNGVNLTILLKVDYYCRF